MLSEALQRNAKHKARLSNISDCFLRSEILRSAQNDKMKSAHEKRIRQTGCDVRLDNLTRQLYSTDASIYQIHPVGAAFPRTAEQASLVIHATADAGLSITPRGAGTSLVGNAIGEGLIVDFSRYNRQITDLDLEKRS